MLRQPNRPGRGAAPGGQGLCRWDAAGGDRGQLCGRVDTAVPGVQRAPNPSRFLRVRNMETPTGSSVDNLVLVDAGKPTVREAELLGGNRMPKKRTPVAERQQETGTLWPLLQAAVLG